MTTHHNWCMNKGVTRYCVQPWSRNYIRNGGKLSLCWDECDPEHQSQPKRRSK